MKALRAMKIGLIGAAAGLALFSVLLLVLPASAASGSVYIDNGSAAPGGSDVVDLTSNVGAPGLGAWTVDVQYDPSVISVTDCSEAGGSVCNAGYAADIVRVTGASASGNDGPTVLASITFECDEAEGGSALHLITDDADHPFVDATVGDPQPIDVTISDGTFTCAAEPVPTATPEGNDPCAQYVYQEFAQDVLNLDPTDPYGLDPDFDHIACENLPPKPIVCGVTYVGDIAGGGTIRVETSPDCNGISSIGIFNFHTPCADISEQTIVDPPTPIWLEPTDNLLHFDHSFLAGPNQAPIYVYVHGWFLETQTISGYVSIGSDDDPQCEQDARAFVASPTEAAPPPTSQPTATPASQVQGTTSSPTGGTTLPDAGDGPTLSGASAQDWIVAGLAGAGIAWFIAGLAGAGIAAASAMNGRRHRAEFTPVMPPPAEPVMPLPAEPVAPESRTVVQETSVAETPRLVPTSRRGSPRWAASARSQLSKVDVSSMPDFDWWKIRRHRGR